MEARSASTFCSNVASSEGFEDAGALTPALQAAKSMERASTAMNKKGTGKRRFMEKSFLHRWLFRYYAFATVTLSISLPSGRKHFTVMRSPVTSIVM